VCTLVESAFERSVLSAYTTDQEIVVLLCHGSSLSECRFRRPSHQKFLSLARPRAVEILQNAERERNRRLEAIHSHLHEKRYLHAVSIFQEAFATRADFRDPIISQVESRIVRHLKPVGFKGVTWERDFHFGDDGRQPPQDQKYYEAFTCTTGLHVLELNVNQQGETSALITEVASSRRGRLGSTRLQKRRDGIPMWDGIPKDGYTNDFFLNSRNGIILSRNGMLLRLLPLSSSGDGYETCDVSFPDIFPVVDNSSYRIGWFTGSVVENYALGSDSDWHLAIWRLDPFEQILITDGDWEADFVEGLLFLERNPGAHVRLCSALHKFATRFVACHGMRVFRSFARQIKAMDKILAQVPQKLRHCYNLAAAEANVRRVSRRDANETIKKIYEGFVEDDISALEGGGVISQDGKWIIMVINVDSPTDRTLLVQFSSRSLQTGFLFEVPDEAPTLRQLRLINGDQTLVGLADEELLTWCVDTGKITDRIHLPEKGRSMDAKCYPFVFVGFESGYIAVIDAARSLVLIHTSAHSQPVDTLVLSDDNLRLVINSRRVLHVNWEYSENQTTTVAA
jgi:hypothetical protein